MRRLILATLVSISLTALSVAVVFAQWPTTCVELNDIVENHLGNQGNVGIYQRTFGDQAEAACQNDHRDDVRSVFAWAIGTFTPSVVEPDAAESSKPTLVFSDLNWNSAQIQNRIAQYIVENGYGYTTDVVFGATIPLFQGLRRGDSHITMEIWLPSQDEAWNEALAAGEVVSIGLSLGRRLAVGIRYPQVSPGSISGA